MPGMVEHKLKWILKFTFFLVKALVAINTLLFIQI